LIGLIPDWGIHLALPLAAFGTLAATLIHRPRAVAWRWAALGSLFWSLEESSWAIVRLLDLQDTIPITDTLYLAGAAAWFVALHTMPGRLWPRSTIFATLPPIGLLIWLLAKNANQTFVLQFPIFDVLLLLYALPVFEGSFHGRASEGRLLLGLGFFVRALAGGLLAWLGPALAPPLFFWLLWVFGYTFMGVGIWLEQRQEDGGLFSIAYVILGLETVIGLVLSLTYLSTKSLGGNFIATSSLLGYSLFVGIFLVVAADRQRRLKAEQELKTWATLLEQLVTYQPSNQEPAETMRNTIEIASELFPHLSGMEVYARGNIRVGQTDGYPVPIVADGAEVGHLYFGQHPENSDALDALTPLIARQVMQSLAQAEWRAQALTDPLTGLFNRRGLDSQETGLLALARAHHEEVSVVMIDLDHFKRVNDFYGHTNGDNALKTLAAILKRNTRNEDLVVRWGGEEFVLILCGATLEAAQEIVRRIRGELRSAVFPSIGWPLTISAGISGGLIPPEDSTLDPWIQAADGALLSAKAGGRDRVITAC